MSLVLAIEPDAAQAAILRDIARSLAIDRLEIVASNDDALRFLLRDVPDLILVTALQAPGEEDALLVHLRTLAGAPHLQTLTIPQLRVPASAKSSSLRFGFRRRAESEPVGCDPDVFREQVRAYLAWAAEVRSHAVEAASMALELADAQSEPLDGATESVAPANRTQYVQAVADDDVEEVGEVEEWVEVALDELTDVGIELPRNVSPAEDVGPTAAELKARHAEELARLQAEADALRAAAAQEALRAAAIEQARVQAESDAREALQRARLEAEAREALERERLDADAQAREAMERIRLHAEAETRDAVERARLQAEVEAREAIERARTEAEAEARTLLEQELAAVRQHAEQAFAETLSRVREEAAETLAAEVGRAREEAAVLQLTEVTRVEGEAETRLQALLEEALAAAAHSRQADLADAKWRAEEVRDAAAREARAVAEVAAASTLNAEIERVRADAEQRVAAEVARVREDAERQRAAELDVLRSQIAEVKAHAAKRAATVIVAPAVAREPQRVVDTGLEPKWTVPTHLEAARKKVAAAPIKKGEPSQAPSQSSGSYYSLWGSDRSAAPPSSLPRGRLAQPSAFRQWALPIAATLVLVSSGGVVINLASFDPISWARRSAAPAAVQADTSMPATPAKSPRTKRTVRPRPVPAQAPAVGASTTAELAPALDAAPRLAVSPFGSVHVTAPPGTMISIAGAQVGQAPVSLSLPVGTHEVVGAHPELGEMRQRIEVRGEERVIVGLEGREKPNPESQIPKNDQLPTTN